MSFILKALKKIETEKAAGEAGPAAISSAILTPGTPPFSPPRRAVRLLIVIPLVFVAGVGTTYVILHSPATPAGAPRATEARSGPVTRTAPPSPVLPQHDKPEPAGTQIPPPEKSVAEQISPRLKAREKVSSEPSPNGGKTSPALPGQPAPVGAGSSSLAVSGIAFQDDPADSVAVVNGVLVKAGMTIGGVEIDRIFQDRVRFRGSGGTFEVHLAK